MATHQGLSKTKTLTVGKKTLEVVGEERAAAGFRLPISSEIEEYY